MSCRVVLYLNDGLPAFLLLYFCCCTFSHPSIIFHNKLKDLFMKPQSSPPFSFLYQQLSSARSSSPWQPLLPHPFYQTVNMQSHAVHTNNLKSASNIVKEKIYKLVLFLLSPNVLLYIMIFNSPIMDNGIKFIFFPSFDFSLIFIIWSEFILTYRTY